MTTDRRATADPQKLDRILSSVQAMLRGIETEPDGPEKDRMREQSERLMREYRITEDELLSADLAAGRAPIAVPGLREFPVAPLSSPYLDAYWRMASYIASHCEVRMAYRYGVYDGATWVVAQAVGYEGDTRYAEALYTEARAFFLNRMEPKVNPAESDEDNVYRLRSAGIERGRIGVMMGWGGEGTTGPAKVTRAYKRACAARGVDAVMTGRSTDVKLFRESFADQFPMTLYVRLAAARDASDLASGGALVLASRKDRVDEEFYRLFPERRPVQVAETTQAVEPKAKKGREPRWTAADERRWQRQHSETANLGRAAGRSAAEEVQIKGVNTNSRIES